MPIAVTCSSCMARLNAPDSAAGRAVKCSQCAAVVTVPAADPGYEVVDAPRPVARAGAARPARDADDARPTRKPRVVEDDDEDDRPRKRRPPEIEDDYEDDYDRPRRSKAKGKKKGGIPVWVFAAGGGGALLAIGVVVAVVMFGGKGGPGGVFRSTPPGFTDVRDSEGGFQVYLPGQVRKAEFRNKDQARVPLGFEMSAFGGTDGNTQVSTRAIKPGDNFNPDNSPDQLYGLLNQWGGGIESPWNEIVSRTPVTLDGRPALEVRVKEKKDWMKMPAIEDRELPLPANASAETRKQFEEGRKFAKQVRDDIKKSHDAQVAADMAKPGRREVYYITTNGKRIIIIHLKTKGEFISDEVLKTIRESFGFI